ncbi:MAG: PAS domain-containing sensor histidine kinase [Janthinobacterium lividum]
MQNTLEFYKLILKSLKDYAVFTTDKEGTITTWSEGAENVLLYVPEETIGKSAKILYTPEDVSAQVPEMELETARKEGKAIDERFHVKKGGQRFWATGFVFPLCDEDDQHIGFTKIMRNLSDQEQAEANLKEEKALAKLIATTYNESIVVLNADLKVMNYTPAFLQFFSLDRQNITGKYFYDLMAGRIDTEQLQAAMDKIIQKQDFYSNHEVDYQHPQTGVRTLLLKPRRIYQPPSILFRLEFEDLTDNKEAMEEKDVFISVASHEIRTPISVIKAYGQVLERELTDAKPIVKTAVKKVNEQISLIGSLTSALLDTTKITTGKLNLDYEVFNLCSLIKELTESFNLSQPSHQIIILNEADSMVYADKARSGSVFTNLLSNAVKYSPKANKVTVSIETMDHTVKVSVQDFGLGVPADEHDKLFQRFGRTESVKKAKIPGNGLGLHLSAEVFKLEGGQIGFISEEGKGSTFYFTLPIY